MPDVAVFVAVLTLAYVLFLFDGWRKLFRDSDTGWHILTGEAILKNHVLPRTDSFSFSRPGAPWLDWEWASDVLSGAAHLVDGLPGVALLFAASIAVCSWLWFRLSWSAGGDFLLACLLAIPMLSTVNMHWLARPHVFGWVLLLIWMWWMERGGGVFTGRHALTASAIGAVWANLHGSFFFAPLLALFYAFGAAATPLVWDTPGRHKSRWYASAAFFASFGTLLNPYGIELHRHVFSYLNDAELLSRIGEFQSYNFHASGSGWILATLLIAALGAVLALGNRQLEHFFVSAFFVALALRSARALPIVALCVLPIANANIAAALRKARGLTPWLRARLDAALEYSGRLRVLDAGVSGWAIVPVVLFVVFLISRSPAVAASTGFPPDQFPVAAAVAVERLPLDARLLAPDKFGGYLIYRFKGQRKIFFDGRSDFYGARFMKEYLRLLEVRPGWRDGIAGYRFTHALLPKDSSLLAALEGLGWREIYKDGTAALLAAPE